MAPSKASPKDELALMGYWAGNSSDEPEPSESWLAMSGCSMVDRVMRVGDDEDGACKLIGACGGAWRCWPMGLSAGRNPLPSLDFHLFNLLPSDLLCILPLPGLYEE